MKKINISSFDIFNERVDWWDYNEVTANRGDEPVDIKKITFDYKQHALRLCELIPECQFIEKPNIDPELEGVFIVEPPEGFLFCEDKGFEIFFPWRFELAEFYIKFDISLFTPNPHLLSLSWFQEIGGFNATFDGAKNFVRSLSGDHYTFRTITKEPKKISEIKELYERDELGLAKLNENVVVIYHQESECYAGAILNDENKTWIHISTSKREYKKYLI